jgi:hypothetical protein
MAAERLYSSSVELTELGTHAGMRLRGRVRRRALRLAPGAGSARARRINPALFDPLAAGGW